MASFNKLTIVGYLGRDPELKYTPTGTAICKFSVATTDKRGEQQTTTWFRVTAWGRQGELANEYLSKGSQVYVEGRVSLQTYTDRDGQSRSTLELNASDVQFLGKKGEQPSEFEGERETAAPSKQQALARQESNSDPRPKTLGDLVTPKQLWLIRNTAREMGISAEDACRSKFHCALEEISKQSASALIEYIKQVGEGLAEQNAEQDDEIPF